MLPFGVINDDDDDDDNDILQSVTKSLSRLLTGSAAMGSLGGCPNPTELCPFVSMDWGRHGHREHKTLLR